MATVENWRGGRERKGEEPLADQPPRPLRGWKILVPRGGTWGSDVAEAVRSRGAFPIVAPLINFASPSADDAVLLREALARLAAGSYDWVVITSATAVDVMHSMGARLGEGTLVAAVGETTAAALSAAGYRVDFVPTHDNSAKGMLIEWPQAQPGSQPARVLWLRSEIAKPVVAERLSQIGHEVDSVVAYRTVGVPVAESIRYDMGNSRIRAVLVTSGSVAVQLHEQFGPLPEDIYLAVIGPRTAKDARELGLRVDVVARQRSIASLLDGLEWLATGAVMDDTVALDLRAIFGEQGIEDGAIRREDVPANDDPAPREGTTAGESAAPGEEPASGGLQDAPGAS